MARIQVGVRATRLLQASGWSAIMSNYPLFHCQYPKFMPTSKRSRGRPPGTGRGRIHDRTLQMRVTATFLRTIDNWRRRQPETISRAEAIRQLVEKAIADDYSKR